MKIVQILLLCIVWNLSFAQTKTPLLSIEFYGLDNSKGNVLLEITDKNGKVIKQEIVPIKNNRAKYAIKLPNSGEFGIKAYHDENNNQRLDKNFVGYPIEKWGVSGKTKPKFRAPQLEEILIAVLENQSIFIRLD